VPSCILSAAKDITGLEMARHQDLTWLRHYDDTEVNRQAKRGFATYTFATQKLRSFAKIYQNSDCGNQVKISLVSGI
jgi:hypothetical protein